jgi:SAM-dependent methyltransferase
MKSYSCPICNNLLRKTGPSYSIRELLRLWAPAVFSEKTFEEHIQQSDYTQMYLCTECKLEIFFPQIIGTPDFYRDLLKSESIYFYSDEKWDFDEALKDARKLNSIIEIGCGPGNFLEKVKPYVAQVYGTEYNEHALRNARDKGLKVFKIDDKNVAKMKGQFDAAFSFHVLEHVSNPVDFVQEMLSWINPCGKIGISVPNMDGPVKHINPCISNMPPHHATRWRLQTFQVLAERLGLTIERVAFEPLSMENHSYYSVYWVNHALPGNSFIIRLIRCFMRKALYMFFVMLSSFGKHSVACLKGQSIYVCLSKAE